MQRPPVPIRVPNPLIMCCGYRPFRRFRRVQPQLVRIPFRGLSGWGGRGTPQCLILRGPRAGNMTGGTMEAVAELTLEATRFPDRAKPAPGRRAQEEAVGNHAALDIERYLMSRKTALPSFAKYPNLGDEDVWTVCNQPKN